MPIIQKSALLAITLLSASIFTLELGYAEPQTNQVAAIIDGKPISIKELDAQIEHQPMLAFQKQQAGSDPDKIKQLRKAALESMIERQVLLSKALEHPKLPPEELAKSVSTFIEANYRDEKELEKILKGMGTDLAEFKRNIGDDFLIRAYLSSILTPPTPPSDAQLKVLFDKNPAKYVQKEGIRARHILLKLGSTPTAEQIKDAEAKITKIRAEIESGSITFPDAAKKYSNCPSASRGGDLGRFSRGAMVPQFEEAAFSLKNNEISAPVRTEFGIHIIKVEEHVAASEPSLQNSKPALIQEYTARAEQEEIRKKLAELKKSVKVEMKL